MEFKEVLEARYSCRAFLPEAVSDEVIRELVAASQRIPTWGNTQPGKVYAVSGAKAHALRIDLTAAATAGQDENPDIPMPQGFEGRLMDRYRALGKSLFKVLGIGRDDREKRREHYINNFNAFGAPTLVYFTVPDRQSPYVIMDVGAMVSTFAWPPPTRGSAPASSPPWPATPMRCAPAWPSPTTRRSSSAWPWATPTPPPR